MPCGLCLGDDEQNPNRIGGVELCHHCFEGGAEQAARRRGFTLTVNCGVHGYGDNRYYGASGTAGIGAPLFDVGFYRKTTIRMLLSLFGMGLRVNDPLFHKIGVILAWNKARPRAFIDDDGAQSAVMDLLGEDVSVRIKSTGVIKIYGMRRSDPFDQTAIEREVAVLLVHLHDFVESRERG